MEFTICIKHNLRIGFKKLILTNSTYLFSFIFSAISFNASAQYNKLFDFSGVTDGSQPVGSLVTDGNYLFGMTKKGGANDSGSVFKIKTDGTGFIKIYDFNKLNGFFPNGSLIYDGTFLYGMTTAGGNFSGGVIFKIKPDGTNFTKLHDFNFNSSDGNLPMGSLFFDGSFLYGTTFNGGTNNGGIVFKVMTNGSGYIKLFDFLSYPESSNPNASLISDGTYLYGTTTIGGSTLSASGGSVFRLMPNGASYSVIVACTNTFNGTAPYGSLISDGTYLYGTFTQGGNPSNDGALFKVKPDGTGFSTIYRFNVPLTGNYSYGDLILSGNYLFGLNFNTLYAIKTDGTGYINVFNFTSGINGSQPLGSLINDSNYLYGTTQYGGNNNMGVIFKFNYTTVGLKEISKSNNQINISPNPSTGKFVLNMGEYDTCYSLQIYNTFGECVYNNTISTNNYNLDLSNYGNGIYYAFIQNNNKKSVGKLIIQH